MRKRTPGYYVRVGTTTFGRPAELLDGPWGSEQHARARAAEILVTRSREGTTCEIVRVERDGVTVTPVDEG